MGRPAARMGRSFAWVGSRRFPCRFGRSLAFQRDAHLGRIVPPGARLRRRIWPWRAWTGGPVIRMLNAPAVAAAALLLVPTVSIAQWAPQAPPSAATATPAQPPSPEAAADARLSALQSQLHITDAQMPAWNAFAQVMRQNASGTDSLFRQRAQSVSGMSALDNMKSYAQIARAYADNTEALATAFEALYAGLSDQQKQTIDGMFRQDAARNASAGLPKP